MAAYAVMASIPDRRMSVSAVMASIPNPRCIPVSAVMAYAATSSGACPRGAFKTHSPPLPFASFASERVGVDVSRQHPSAND